MAKNIPSNENQGLQPRLLYPARLSIKIEGQMRSFPDKQKSKRIQLHQTSSARDAKGTALRKGRKREKEGRTQRKESKAGSMKPRTGSANWRTR